MTPNIIQVATPMEHFRTGDASALNKEGPSSVTETNDLEAGGNINGNNNGNSKTKEVVVFADETVITSFHSSLDLMLDERKQFTTTCGDTITNAPQSSCDSDVPSHTNSNSNNNGTIGMGNALSDGNISTGSNSNTLSNSHSTSSYSQNDNNNHNNKRSMRGVGNCNCEACLYDEAASTTSRDNSASKDTDNCTETSPGINIYNSSELTNDASQTKSDQNSVESYGIARKENEAVQRMRLMLFIFLFATTIIVSGLVYQFSKNREMEEFKAAFRVDSLKIFDSLSHSLDTKLNAIDSFAMTLASSARERNETWPFTSLPYFAAKAAKIRTRPRGQAPGELSG